MVKVVKLGVGEGRAGSGLRVGAVGAADEPLGVRPPRTARRSRDRLTRQGRRPRQARSVPFRLAVVLTALVLVAVCALVSVSVGSSALTLGEIWEYLTHPDASVYDSVIVNTLRPRRTVLGLLVGTALAVAGALMQAVTRNPLAEPGLLGVTSGASLAVVLGSWLTGATSVPEQFGLAAAGSLAATVVVYLVASLGGAAASPVRLLLVGVAFSAAASAAIQALLLSSPRTFATFRYWDAGALLRTDVPLGALAAVVAVGTLIALSCSRGLTNLSLGDDVAAALGTRVVLVRALSLVSLTLLCGAATAAAGPVGFVGLIVPLAASWLMGPHRGWIIVLSALMGPCLVLAADVVGRVISRPGEIQVGLLTAFVGSPVLLVMVLRLKDARL
ncbi:iron ABC transporter permease [Actinomyces lilanjuaniae]|uniref:Iron ABC transporter permease n=1 Tax=Actinomyces lilanjuaniae TaxID=2321394 RepID=A0ABN5PTV8_9ACTO|nr:iron ABC transporter permease [Actinomyces lilanjuaniae]